MEDEGDELERRRLTKTRDQLSDLLARIDEAQRQADKAHRDAEDALRRFEDGE